MKRLSISLAALMLAGPVLAQDAGQSATATFIDQQGQEVGTATLTQAANGVEITGQVTGLTEGEHGFHIHETGDCAPDTQFESAGAHFSPENREHGAENPNGPHAGDMGNVTADAEGTADLSVTNDRVSLNQDDEGYLFDDDGSALMVHADADDEMTDPGGNSGDRVACAVIEAASAPAGD